MEIIKATEYDCNSIANILVSSWREAYREIMPSEMLDNLSVEQRAEGWKKHLSQGGEAYIFWVAGEAVGVVEVSEFRDKIAEFAGFGEIPVIYLLPEKYGSGLGSRLLEFATEALKKKGFDKVCVWVLERNLRAINFYKRNGFSPSHLTKTHSDTGLLELLYTRVL